MPTATGSVTDGREDSDSNAGTLQDSKGPAPGKGGTGNRYGQGGKK